MKILLSAAETSSDTHGAELLKAIRELVPAGEKVEFFGIGGPKLQEAGLRAIIDARDLLAMGFSEVVGRLPRILEALREVSEAAAVEKPDLAVVIDYPEFHFRLARRLKRLGVPVIYYIPPKIWAWRSGRIHKMRELFAKVLCILPFEKAFYEEARVPVTYVGNPLVDELPLSTDRAQARAELGLSPTMQVLTLMPGSRPSELRQHIELMLDSATIAAARLRSTGFLRPEERLKVLVPFPMTSEPGKPEERVKAWLRRMRGDGVGVLKPAEPRARAAEAGSEFILDIQVSRGDSHLCLLAADAALVKSGTGTLEAGLLGCPHAVVYRPNQATQLIVRYLVRYQGPVGMVNLVAEAGHHRAKKPYLIDEILCENATPANLAQEIVALFTDSAKRERISQGLVRLRSEVLSDVRGGGLSRPSARAAQEVLGTLRALQAGTQPASRA